MNEKRFQSKRGANGPLSPKIDKIADTNKPQLIEKTTAKYQQKLDLINEKIKNETDNFNLSIFFKQKIVL